MRAKALLGYVAHSQPTLGQMNSLIYEGEGAPRLRGEFSAHAGTYEFSKGSWLTALTRISTL